MNLRSIPPANRSRRRPLDRLSSMRAATRTGMIFVGGSVGGVRPNGGGPQEPPRKVGTYIPPNKNVANEREAAIQTLSRMAADLDALIEELIASGETWALREAHFWEEWRNDRTEPR